MIAESSPFPWFSTARRRTRRMIVVAYWLVAVVLFGVIQWAEAFRPGHLSELSLLFPLYALTFLPAILGGVRAGGMVKPFRGAQWLPLGDDDEMQTLLGPRRPLKGSMTAADLELDERDVRDRDNAHFQAYTTSRWLALLLLIVQVMACLAGPAWLLRAGNAAFLLLALVLWSLPQSIILWTEQDMEEPR